MARKALVMIFTAALAVSWAAPLCASSTAPNHDCCEGGMAPMSAPTDTQAPACCRAPDAVPVGFAAAVEAPVTALPCSGAIAAEPPAVERIAPPRFAAASPQAPPGTHSGLSPPPSGL